MEPTDAQARRLAALAELEIMDTPPEAAYDDLARLASYICQAPIAYISFLDGERQWYKSRINVPFEQTTIDEALCAQVIHETELVQIPDLKTDPRFADNALVHSSLGIRFYASYPLVVSEGGAVGTICVIDFASRTLDDHQKEALEALGRQVVAQLELRRAMRALKAAHDSLQKAHAEVSHRALHDPLTELANRTLLSRRLAKACAAGEPFAVLFVDLDRFKQINDTYGHLAGDTLLKRVAQRLQRSTRKDDIVTRFGGDEFVIVAHGIKAGLEAVRLARALETEVSKPYHILGNSLGIEASVGVAIFPQDATTPDELLRAADGALYVEKEARR